MGRDTTREGVHSCHMITEYWMFSGLEIHPASHRRDCLIRSFNLFIDIRKEEFIQDIRDPHLIAPIRRQVDSLVMYRLS